MYRPKDFKNPHNPKGKIALQMFNYDLYLIFEVGASTYEEALKAEGLKITAKTTDDAIIKWIGKAAYHKDGTLVFIPKGKVKP